MSLKISRILHAGYLFESENTKIAFDPIFENPFSRNCHAFPEVQFDQEMIKQLKLDAVFISHFHDDHFSMESLNLLNRDTPIYAYSVFEEMFSLIKELGFKNVHSIILGVPIKIGAFEVTPHRALDADVDSIFQITVGTLNVLNVVDSWIDYEMLEELSKISWDMILWPFQTMREIEVLSPSRAAHAEVTLPEEWAEQLQKINPKNLVPSSCQFLMESWSWYNHAFFPISYEYFAREMQKILPETKIVRMNPSVSFRLGENSIESAPSLPWILPVGEQDVDYDYQTDFKPPPTSEIAKHFAALSDLQTEQVFEYCRIGLIEKYEAMYPSEHEYFEKSLIWKLSIYDHNGEATGFYYRLEYDKIELLSAPAGPLSWFTEVPIAKLYAALELGEALTSMYLRINDMVFETEIEKQIQDVDVVEDPLIRSLFTGAFGAYQIAQLKQIKPS